MDQAKTIKLLIADDHEVVRSGIKSLVAGTDIEVVAEAGTADEAVRLAEERRPGIRTSCCLIFACPTTTGSTP